MFARRKFFRIASRLGKGKSTASSGQDITGSVIGAGTTLKGSGLATQLNLAFLPGVITTGNVKELVSGVNKAIALSGAAASGTDADGMHLSCPNQADHGQITATFDPAGGAYSVVMLLKPLINPPAGAWANLVAMRVGLSGFYTYQLGRYFTTNDFQSGHIKLNDGRFTDAATHLTTGGLAGLVNTWDGTTEKLYYPGGNGTPITFAMSAAQETDVMDTLVLGDTAAGENLGWPAKYYFFGYSNTCWNATDSQNVADNVYAQLLTG